MTATFVGTLLVAAIAMSLSLAPTARATGSFSFCTSYNAGPDGGGSAQCHGTMLTNLSAVQVEKGARPACASALTQMGVQYDGWVCTTTGNYATHYYNTQYLLYPLIKNNSSAGSNVISGVGFYI